MMRLLLCGALLSVAIAMFADQAGVDDRSNVNIGPVRHAAASGRNLVVSTDAGMVAAINQRTGEAVWRIAVADGEEFLSSSATDKGYFTLSQLNGRAYVRSYGADDGSLRWEQVLANEVAAGQSAPATLHASNQASTVAAIFGGSVFTVSILDGKLASRVSATEDRIFVSAGYSADGILFAVSVPSMSAGGIAPSFTLHREPRSGGGAIGRTLVAKQISVRNTALIPQDGGVAVVSGTSSGLLVHCGDEEAAQELTVANLVEGSATDAAVVVTGLQAVHDTSAIQSSAKPKFAYVRVQLSSGAVSFLSIDTASKCRAEVVFSVAAATGPDAVSVAAGSVTAAGGVSFLVVAESSSAAGMVTTTIPGAASASKIRSVPSDAAESAEFDGLTGVSASVIDSKTHGNVRSIFPVRFTKSDGKSAGWRALLVQEDGTASVVQSGKVVWSKEEGSACVAQLIGVDVPRRRILQRSNGNGASGGDASASDAATASLSSDPALSFTNRLTSQVSYLQQVVTDFSSSIGVHARAMLVDPVAAALDAIRGGSRTAAGGPGKQMAPSVPQPFEKLFISRSRVDGGFDTCSSAANYASTEGSGIIGSLTAAHAESGEKFWSIALPVAPGARDAAAAASSSSAPLSGPDAIKSTMVVSRPRPIQSHPAELLMVESAPISGAGSGSVKYGVWLTWINAETGAAVGSAHYTSPSPIRNIAKSPVFHIATHRQMFVIVHADGAAVIAPGPSDVVASMQRLGPDYVISEITFDAGSDSEGVSGVALDFSTASVSSSTIAIQTGAGVKPCCASAHAVELAVATTVTAWQAVVATGVLKGHASASGPGERVLAVTTGGGIAGHAVLSSISGEIDAALQDAIDAEAAAASESSSAGGASSDSPASKGVQILGDDSLLLKYTNPNLIAVAVGWTGPTQSHFERVRQKERLADAASQGVDVSAALSASNGAAASSTANLTIYIYDSVSGRLLHTRRHSGATGPIAMLHHDHWVVYSFWNSKARRPEIGVAAMYEGAIDTYQLTPWSRTNPIASRSSSLSSHTSPAPVIKHSTFILPTTIKALAVTHTHLGITTPHFLFATQGNGLMMVDRRLLDPRRPTGEPKDHEKAEGLMQYSPHLPLRHSWMLNHDRSVSRLHTILSVPTSFESTTLVAAVGADHFYSRIAPAKAFDQLDPEFNFALFVILLVVGGVGTVMMGRAAGKKDMVEAWK